MSAKTATLALYRDAKGEWRWQFRAPNGRIIADGSEGYKRYQGAINGFHALMDYTRTYKIAECDAPVPSGNPGDELVPPPGAA